MSDDIIEHDLNRREFLALTSAAGASGLAGCVSGGGEEQTVRLNVAISAEVWNFDPALWTDTATSTVGGLVYDEVIELDTDENLQPGLAESVPEPKNDGKAFDITLREGLTFHSGDEVTVEDFKYSVDWILNPENNSPVKSRLPFVTDTEIVGDRTLRLNLEQAFTTLPFWLTRGLEGIVPKDSRGSVETGKGPSGLATDLTKDPTGAGTGPFKFVEWESGSHVRLERYEDYWKDDQPKVDEIQFEFIGENSTRLANLQSGEVHLTDKVPPKDFASLADDGDITTQEVPGSTTQVLYLNLMDSGDNPMANVNNRRAVLFGIDAREILDEVFEGHGVVQKGPWYPGSEFTSPKLKEMTLYDPEKAREELAKAGNPDGFELDIIATKGSWFKDEAITIQSQLSNIGIDVNVTAVEKSTLFNQVYGTTDWHAAMEDWGQAIPVATYWLDAGYADNNHNHNNWHHPSEDLKDPYEPSGPPAPEDASGDYSNGHEWFVDTLRTAQSTTDSERQKELIWRLEEYVVENAIQIDIAYINKLEAWRNSVGGYEVGSFVDEYRKTTLDTGE
ncbi:MAG: ABC transporter substrate-binding protein [Halolamina sp.]